MAIDGISPFRFPAWMIMTLSGCHSGWFVNPCYFDVEGASARKGFIRQLVCECGCVVASRLLSIFKYFHESDSNIM